MHCYFFVFCAASMFAAAVQGEMIAVSIGLLRQGSVMTMIMHLTMLRPRVAFTMKIQKKMTGRQVIRPASKWLAANEMVD